LLVTSCALRLGTTGAVLLGVLVARPAAGHEHTPPPSTTVAAPTQDAPEPILEKRPETEPLKIEVTAALVQHLHNKIVHFPLALGMTGALMLLLAYRWPQFGPGARLLLVIAALTAWAAVRTGLAQEEDLEGGEMQLWLDRHELAGKCTAAALTLIAALALVKRARPIHWLLALLAVALLSWTAFLGGILAHTPT
jgi:uncharacterized membrane protein